MPEMPEYVSFYTDCMHYDRPPMEEQHEKEIR